MKFVQQTRFKAVLLGLILGLVEGLLKVAWPAFPVIEVFGFQGALIGYYFTVRTISGIKSMDKGQEPEDKDQ